ncbi:MAG: hypothetical protein V3U84_05345, partial [Thiotrichaceae bacterium]
MSNQVTPLMSKIVLFLCLAFSFAVAGEAKASLNAGDIIVIGVTGDDTDQLTWVPLVDLPAGEVINFTDNGWNTITNTWASSGGLNGEGSIQFTVPDGGITAGSAQTVVFQSEGANYSDITSPGNAISGVNGFSTTGDQLTIWQGTTASPVLIFQINLDANLYVFDASRANASNPTALASGLTVGTTAVAVGAGANSGDEVDGAYYSGAALSGAKAAILALVANNTNWTGGDALGTDTTTYDQGVATAIAGIAVSGSVAGTVGITGSIIQGQTVTAIVNDADGIMGAISYQWKANDVDIGGATGNTFVLTQAQVNKTITVQASYTDNGGATETPVSAVTSVVANVNDAGSVSISGHDIVGETITSSVIDDDGLINATISYQWKADGTPITGATNSTYTFIQANVGTIITLTVTYTDDLGGNETLTSNIIATPAIVSPTVDSTLTGETATFGLARNGENVTLWAVWVGSVLGGNDTGGSAAGAENSLTVSGLPTDGSTVYVRLLYQINNVNSWIVAADYTFVAATASLPAITSPLANATLSGETATFTLAKNGTSVTQWAIWLGSTLGGNETSASADGSATTLAVSAIPTDGRAIHVRLLYQIDNVNTW